MTDTPESLVKAIRRKTRKKRADRSDKMAELYALEMLGRKIGLITGPKTSGRKPGE
mgnify:CR=1 FL=1